MAIQLQQTISQSLRQTQELVMTPQLQQAIKLLQLTRMELIDQVQEEMEQNPLLEEEEGEGNVPEDAAAQDETRNSTDEEDLREKAEEQKPPEDWEQYLAQYDTPPQSDRPLEIAEERSPLESYLAPEQTLSDHLMWQLVMGELTEAQQQIGTVIIGNIDEKGYFRAETADVAEQLGVEEAVVLRVLRAIQRFEPTGVAARDLRECLLLQAKERGSDPKVVMVIEQGLKFLESKNYNKLAALLGLTFDQVVEAAREVATFEPWPGRALAALHVDYVMPDIYVKKQNGKYVVQLNDEGLPRLRISSYYRSILTDGTEGGKEAKSYIQERMQAAQWLIKSIQQRQQTLFKTATSIVNFQLDFLENGSTHLRPLVLKDVAEDIEMHESTISRVTTGKYMHTPQGTFELKYFFSSAIKRDGAKDLASRSVKERMREIIAREDPTKPLSDLKIAELLSEEFSLLIARRTVSKYRENMGVLPSSSRKSYF
jgi:RNA polymerase sigma-54 factor